MKKAIATLLAAGLAASLLAGCGGTDTSAAPAGDTAGTAAEAEGPLEGEITFWHSFTQGARMDAIQKAADAFMAENPGVKINIETYSWGDFNTKWNAGITTGDLPDISTAQGTGEVVEMINAGVIDPMDAIVDDIGRDRFSENALADMSVDGTVYGIPYYSHAQVMWYRTDLMEAAGLEVPQTWDEFYDAAVAPLCASLAAGARRAVYACLFVTFASNLFQLFLLGQGDVQIRLVIPIMELFLALGLILLADWAKDGRALKLDNDSIV